MVLVSVTYYGWGGARLEVSHWDDAERARRADLLRRDRILEQLGLSSRGIDNL